MRLQKLQVIGTFDIAFKKFETFTAAIRVEDNLDIMPCRSHDDKDI